MQLVFRYVAARDEPRAAAALGLGANPGALGDTKSVTTRRVRHVAPGKYMLLLSFTLPGKAAYGEKGGV